MKIILVFFALFLCLGATGQHYIIKQVNSDHVAQFEKALEATLTERNGNITTILSPSLYPMVAQKNLGQPYYYERKRSYFRVPAISEYFFDESGDVLWYTSTSWRATNGVSVFDFDAMEKKLKDEISHKKEYILFYNEISQQISKGYGRPTEKTNVLEHIGKNSVGERKTWETDTMKIVLQIRMPKENTIESLRVTLTTYWK